MGSVLKGQENAVKVCSWLKPEYILSTAAGGNVDFDGLLMKVLKEKGSLDEVSSLLRENQLSTEVIKAIPGQPVSL